ncbi:MAG TPA: NYN domain-containing protein, partial [Roseomonas sp.]|nr:NYN domain-containing protein [Roseomonas sp.]
AMTIDAIDLAHERGLDGFVIVSNDKDFAPLAARLRRSRLRCMLITSKEDFDSAYQKLWDDFIRLPTSTKKSAPPKSPAPKQTKGPPGDTERAKGYRDAIAASDLDGGWARLSAVGKRVPKPLRPTSPKKWLAGHRDLFVVQKRKFKNEAQATDCVRALKKT